MEHYCDKCNKNYASYQSLWIHTKKYHNNSDNHFDNHDNHFDNHDNHFDNHTNNHKNPLTKNYNCRKCNKIFSCFQNRWRHEKKCKETNSNENLKKEIIELKNKVYKLENKKTNNKSTMNIKINGNVINGNNHDSGSKQIIYKTGTEDIDKITYDEVSTIFNNEISSVIKLIELVNFSENKPENHSFCSTALESPYLSFYNTDTKSVNKERKRYFFEDVICKSIQNHEILYSKFKHKFNLTKRKQIEDNIANLKKIKENSFSSKIISEMINNLNLLSYNNRDLVQNTWNGKKYDNESDEEFMAMILDNPETQRIIAENKKTQYDISNGESKNKKTHYDVSDSESEGERPLLFPIKKLN